MVIYIYIKYILSQKSLMHIQMRDDKAVKDDWTQWIGGTQGINILQTLRLKVCL